MTALTLATPSACGTCRAAAIVIVEPECSATPEDVEARHQLGLAAAPIVALGQRSSSNEPSSPRVAVTHTTRAPA